MVESCSPITQESDNTGLTAYVCVCEKEREREGRERENYFVLCNKSKLRKLNRSLL